MISQDRVALCGLTQPGFQMNESKASNTYSESVLGAGGVPGISSQSGYAW